MASATGVVAYHAIEHITAAFDADRVDPEQAADVLDAACRWAARHGGADALPRRFGTVYDRDVAGTARTLRPGTEVSFAGLALAAPGRRYPQARRVEPARGPGVQAAAASPHRAGAGTGAGPATAPAAHPTPVNSSTAADSTP